MSVWDIASHADVISGAGIAPFQPGRAIDENLVATRQDQEILKVVMAVQRHRNSGRHDSAHDANLIVVFRRHELNDRPENFQHRSTCCFSESVEESRCGLRRVHP